MIGKNIKIHKANGEFMGMFIVPKSMCNKFIEYYKNLKNPQKAQIHDFFSFLLKKKQIIKALNIRGNFMEIDTYNDYKIAKKIFS